MIAHSSIPRWLIYGVLPALLVALSLGVLVTLLLARDESVEPAVGDGEAGSTANLPLPAAGLRPSRGPSVSRPPALVPTRAPTVESNSTPVTEASPTPDAARDPAPTVESNSTPVTEASPTPDAVRDPAPPLDDVASEIEGALDQLPGTVGAVILSRDAVVLRNPDRLMPTASVMKLVIAAEALNQIETGRLSPWEPLVVTRSNVVGGTGILRHQLGASYTVIETIEIMLRHSDNTAGNMLIDRLGGFGAVNAFCVTNGMLNTKLNRKFMDMEARARGVENVSTARDISLLFVRLARGDVVSAEASALLLGILEERGRMDRSWLFADVPARVPVAEISGILPGVRNAAGLVFSEAGPYVIVVFVQHSDDAQAERAMTRLGGTVHDIVTRR